MLALVCSFDCPGGRVCLIVCSFVRGLRFVRLFLRFGLVVYLFVRSTRDASFNSAEAISLEKLIPPIMLGRIQARVRVHVCARACVMQRYYTWVLGEYSRVPLPVLFCVVQRYYAWLEKTAAYTRDTPAGHVSVRL